MAQHLSYLRLACQGALVERLQKLQSLERLQKYQVWEYQGCTKAGLFMDRDMVSEGFSLGSPLERDSSQNLSEAEVSLVLVAMVDVGMGDLYSLEYFTDIPSNHLKPKAVTAHLTAVANSPTATVALEVERDFPEVERDFREVERGFREVELDFREVERELSQDTLQGLVWEDKY